MKSIILFLIYENIRKTTSLKAKELYGISNVKKKSHFQTMVLYLYPFIDIKHLRVCYEKSHFIWC